MHNWRLIKKIAIVFGIIFIVFTVSVAFVNYRVNSLLYSGAPASFYQASSIAAMLPFLLFAVLSFVVAAFSSDVAKSAVEKETETQPDSEDVFKEAPT